MNCTFLLRSLVATLGGLLFAVSVRADVVVKSFGTGGNAFSMNFATIGSAGNLGDTTGEPDPAGAGAVGYTYLMGTYEVSESMITKANAPIANGGGNLGITTSARGENKPATNVSWNEAARFVNWLNTSQGFQAAYKFASQPGDMLYNSNGNIALWNSSEAWQLGGENLFRHKDAHFWLPSADEWYKAAYYDPEKIGTDKYWNYATRSDTVPLETAGSMTQGEAVYGGQNGPADITQAGGTSAFGVMGMGGNVWEWEETEFDLVNDSFSSARGVRGGSWENYGSNILSSEIRSGGFPTEAEVSSLTGFRVASLSTAPVPELGTLCSWSAICLCVGFAALRRRRLQAA